MAAGRHFPPLRVLVPELLADHGIFQPGVHRDPFLMGCGEEARNKLPKHLRAVKSPQVNLADGPTFQLRHDHRRVNFGLAAGVEIDTEIVRGERRGDVQLIDDRLRQKRQVLENHPFLRLERDGAVNESPLPAAARDHQRGFVPGVESQDLKCRAHLEARDKPSGPAVAQDPGHSGPNDTA